MGDIFTKYSVYTDDFIRQYLLLNSMGFDKHYGYEKVSIPLMPHYRGSSRGEILTEMNLLCWILKMSHSY